MMQLKSIEGAMTTAQVRDAIASQERGSKNRLSLPDLMLIVFEIFASVGLLVLQHSAAAGG